MNNKEKELIKRRDDLTKKEVVLETEDIVQESNINKLPSPPTNAAEEAALKSMTERRTAISTELVAIRAERDSVNNLIGQINPDRKAEYQELSNLTNRFDFARPIADIKQNTYNVGSDIMIP